MYLNPQETIVKICPNCNRQFESKRFHNKEYCSVKCRQRIKRGRSSLRERQEAIDLKPNNEVLDDRYFLVVTNPTCEQLDSYAKLILDGKVLEDKPIMFQGELPFWTPPAGITFRVQQRMTPDEPIVYLMFKSVPSLEDLLI